MKTRPLAERPITAEITSGLQRIALERRQQLSPPPKSLERHFAGNEKRPISPSEGTEVGSRPGLATASPMIDTTRPLPPTTMPSPETVRVT